MSRQSLAVGLVLMILVGLAPAGQAADPAKGASCAEFVAGANACNVNGCFVCTSGTWVSQPLYLGSTTATCSSGTEGQQRYNATSKAMEYCNGSAWTGLVSVQSTPSPTAPSGSGYFVLTGTTYNGNLGGLPGADSRCLTELATTYTTWNGYTDANSRGLLIAAKVKAFLCNGTVCNNLMPLTNYYFARANSTTAGGAFFTTDSSGLGPQDAANWSAANYFSGTYSVWSNRATTGGTLWSAATAGAATTNHCTTWSLASGSGGRYGAVSNTTALRWNAGASLTCDNNLSLICFVNP